MINLAFIGVVFQFVKIIFINNKLKILTLTKETTNEKTR
jgi:hypothetical protein